MKKVQIAERQTKRQIKLGESKRDKTKLALLNKAEISIFSFLVNRVKTLLLNYLVKK